MAYLLSNVRLLGMPAFWINNRLPALTYRLYATPSSVQEQIAAAVVADKDNNLGSTTVKSIEEVPGPMDLPIFGTMLSMLLDRDFNRNRQDIYLKKLQDTYGDVVRVNFPGIGPILFLYHPDDCETLARVTMNNPIRYGTNSIKKIREEAIDNYFEKRPGLLASNDEEWWRVRSRVQTPLLKRKNVTAYLTKMDEVALDFIDKIAAFQKMFGEMPSDFQAELYKWSLESISLVALNRRMGCFDSNLKEDSEPMILINEANSVNENMNLAELGPQFWRYFPTPVFIRLRNSHNEFLRVADENIRETEARLMAKDPNSEEDLTLMETLLLTPGLTRKDVVTLILDMLFAGIDTTSHTVAFTMYLLSKNPQAQAKLQEEVDTVLCNHEGPLTPKIMAKLTYLKAVLKESLRIFPLVLGTLRALEKDAVIGGYLVPKGHNVGPCNKFMGVDERLFPKPNEFIPERWLRERPLGPIHPYASLPFGLGTRMCIGRRLAEQEIYTLLTRVMQRYTIEYKYQDMNIITRIIYAPSETLRFNFTERRQ